MFAELTCTSSPPSLHIPDEITHFRAAKLLLHVILLQLLPGILGDQAWLMTVSNCLLKAWPKEPVPPVMRMLLPLNMVMVPEKIDSCNCSVKRHFLQPLGWSYDRYVIVFFQDEQVLGTSNQGIHMALNRTFNIFIVSWIILYNIYCNLDVPDIQQ